MSKKDNDVLQAMRDFRKRAEDYWSDIYRKSAEDMEFCINKESQWDVRARKQRKDAGRPCISINKTMLFVKQQVNALRANKMTLNAVPVDDTDVDKATIQDDMLEYVLKSSKSDIATDWAYEKAVMGGFGYWRVTTEYANNTSFNQDIKVKRIENPLSTYLSPEIKCPTGSDAQEAITGEWISHAEFKRKYPNKTPSSALDEEASNTDWKTEDQVFVAEYYRIEYDKDTLYLLDNDETVLESELKQGVFFDKSQFKDLKQREVQHKKIMWYKCSRDSVLESTEIKADFIPIILVVGDEQYVETTRHWQSLIINSKDSQVMYNYARTLQVEQLRKAMNRPIIADAESIQGFEAYWQMADDPNTKYLPYNSTNKSGHQLRPPFLAEVYQGSPDLMREAMTSSDEIKATTGMFDASLGNQGNETSGKAIMARQRQGDQANFHFFDNFKRSYEQGGRVILSMIRHYYDTPRVLRITQDDNTLKTLAINVDPNSKMAEKNAKELESVEIGVNGIYNDVSVGKYDIRIATGADYNTQREEAREVLIELGRAYPALMQVAGDLIVRAFDFPDAEPIAERLKLMLPPQLQENEDGQPQLPPELQQQIQQMQQQMGEMEQALQQAQSELQSKDQDRQVEMAKAQLKAETDLEVAKVRESGRNDQEEIKQYGAMLQKVLEQTANIHQAIAQAESLPPDWQTQNEDLNHNPVNNEQGFLME